MKNEIEELLKNVAFKIGTLNEAKRMFANKLAPDFNIFDYLRGDEVGLSRCIASLLNPTGTHGQGSLFLKNFLGRIDKVLHEKQLVKNWADAVTDGCQVDLEKQANGRRIDIYLRFTNGEIIGIENKPWAWDQKNQLNDYADYIQLKQSKWLLIYLSNFDPANSEISINKKDRENHEKNGNFIWLDYAELVEWLKFCAQNSKALNVRIFIEELAKFVSTKINGELDMSSQIEIKNLILQSNENIESAFNIIKSIKVTKLDLLEKFKKDLSDKSKLEEFELIWNIDLRGEPKKDVSFGLRLSKEYKYYLCFKFDNKEYNGLIWGIRWLDGVIEKDLDESKFISNAMNNEFKAGKKPFEWIWWDHISNGNNLFNEQFGDWDKNKTPWISINKNDLSQRVIDLAKLVNEALKKINGQH